MGRHKKVVETEIKQEIKEEVKEEKKSGFGDPVISIENAVNPTSPIYQTIKEYERNSI